ncbi:MAG: hypothetical protein AAF601_05540 [Pseudomonadota bacterium]
MSFLPYAPVSSKAWFASITGSTALHGLALTAVLTSSVAMLPEPTTPAVREPEYEITLEIIDADIIELEDFEPELEVPEDAVAIAAEDDAASLEEIDDAELLAEEEAEALLPDDTALEAEPEVLEAEPEEIETAQAEEIIPEEEPVIEEEELALLEPEEEPLVPEVEPEAEALIEPEPEPLLEPEPEILVEPEETLPEPEPQIAEALTPIPQDDPDDLTIDDLSLVDDTVINPLAESVAPAAPSDTALAADVVVPDVIDPEPQIVEEDIAALVLPEPETVLPDPTVIEPEPEPVEPVALPIEEEPVEPEPVAPELEEAQESDADPEIALLPDVDAASEPAPAASAARPIANPSPAALQIGALLQRIRATPAPQCTLALPRRAAGGGVGVSFIGATPSDLDTLATRIVEGLDINPAQTREILDPRQCAVLDAVRQASAYPASRIGLALESTTLNSGDSLQARVLGSGGLFLTLVLIDDNGVVQDLARFTTLDGNDPVIDAPVARSGPARDTRQVLVVLGSPDAPIDLSGGIGLLAQDAFAALPAEVLETALFGLATFDVR